MATDTIPLLHRVDCALRQSPHLLGRHVILEEDENSIILRGTVDSFFQKQMAQEALRSLQGIGRIQNHLEVAGRH